jgi:eukaryotic-like serine/threonine-protein kinase
LTHIPDSLPTVRLIEAEPQTPDSSGQPNLNALPRDLLDEGSRRLQLACLVWAALGGVGLVMNTVIGPLILDRPMLPGGWPWPGAILTPVVVALSLGLYVYLRRHPTESERALNLGLGYEVVLALAIGIVNQWTPSAEFHGPSFIVMLILIQPTLVPNTPRRILVTSLIAASVDPLAAQLAALRGVDVPPFHVLVFKAVPSYLAAGIAFLQARIFGRIGRQVKKARELGSYELGEQIGRGGMGEVWRASHRLLARPAAIKLISPQALGAASPEAAQLIVGRFKREAQVAASLQSPHAVDLFDFGISADGTFYLVMELLDGIDLEKAVRRFGPMPADRVIYLLRQACHSLAEAHSRGLVHRDIKPANLFLCRLGLDVDFLKVLDFGLAKWVEDGGREGQKLTAPDVTAGTPAYMSPESALGEKVDHRSDLYSLGCVGYWLLTGHLVFQGESAMRTIIQHVNDPPEPPSRRTERPIPPLLDAAILACLAKRPDERPADAVALDRMLARAGADRWTLDTASLWWNSHLPQPDVASSSPAT